MSSKTKIVVLRMKEIIYTAIFLGLGILLILLLFIMFHPKTDAPASTQPIRYTPGVYTASLTLGPHQMQVEVAVDRQSIRAVTMTPQTDAVATMYPLMQPSIQNLAQQICETQSLNSLTYPPESRYTSQVLIQAIERALAKASPTG